MKKIVYFLLFILILPSVSAFLDLRGFYDSNPFLIDFLVFFAIFSIVTMISFKKFFGDTPLQRALSFVVAFALSFAGIYAGYLSLNAIGELFANSPIVWFLISVLLFIGLFRLVKWIFKKLWLSLLITIVISLCLYYFIFPDNILRMIPLDLELIGSTISLLTVLILIIAVAALIFFGINLLKKGGGDSEHSDELKEDREKRKKNRGLRAILVEPRGLFSRRRINETIKVKPNEKIRFVGKAKGGSGKYVSFEWHLNGSIARKSSSGSPYSDVVHTFKPEKRIRPYRLMFMVTDSEGNRAESKTFFIYIKGEKRAKKIKAFLIEPRVVFGTRRIKVELGERVRFVGMAKGGSGRYVSYSWNLDGGTRKNAPRSFTHIFRSEGRHHLMFGVTDSDGNVGVSKVYLIDVRTSLGRQRKNRFDRILEQQNVSRRPKTKEERNQIRQMLQQQRVGRRPKLGMSKKETKEIQKQDRQQIKKQKMVRHLEYLAQKKDMDLQKWQMMAVKGVEGAKQKVRTLQAELKEISRKIKKYQS